MAIYVSEDFSYIGIGDVTKNCLLLMVIFFNIGYFSGIFSKIKIKRAKIFKKNSKIKRSLNKKRFDVVLYLCLFICLFYFIKAISSGLSLEGLRAVSGGLSEIGIFQSTVDSILFYGIVAPLVNISLILLLFNIINKENSQKQTLLVVVNLILYTYVSGGRTMLVRGVVYIIALLIYQKKNGPYFKQYINYKIVIFVLVVAYISLSIITTLRSTQDITFFKQAIAYIQGSIFHMDHHIVMGSFKENVLWGSINLGGFLYYPIKLINLLFGTAIENSMEKVYYLQSQTYLGIGRYYNALVPAAYYYYIESGYLGVVVYSFLHGIISYFAENVRKKSYSFLRFTMLCICLFSVLYTPLGGILWSSLVPTTIIYALILNKFLYRKVKERTL